MNQVTVPVQDVASAVAFYQGLGLHLVVQSPHYARFVCPNGLATFSVHLHEGAVPPAATTVYFECDHLDQHVMHLKAQGYVFEDGPKDQPWEWREAYLRDPAGNLICLYYAGDTRVNPSWRLEASRSRYFLTPDLAKNWLTQMEAALAEDHPQGFAALFTPDARLLESPFAAPVFGPACIQQHCRKVLGTFATVSSTLIGIQEEVAYAQLEGYWGSAENVVYSAMLALRFNAAGLCQEVVVWGGPALSRPVMGKSVSSLFPQS